MSIRERPDRNLPYEVRWREEGRHRARSFRTERDAIRWDVQVQDRLAQGAHAPTEPSRQVLRDWLAHWLDTYGPAWAESTEVQRADIVDRHLKPMLGGVRLRDLGRTRVATFRRDLHAKASPQTVNAVMRVLSAALTVAVEEGLIPANPCRGLRPIPTAPPDRQPIPLDVVDELLERTTGRDRLIVALLCYAGLRPGELRALRWQDVGETALYVGRAAGREIKTTKTGGVRGVPIRPELAAALNGVERGDGLVAPGERGGLLSWRNWVRRVWRPACDGDPEKEILGLGAWVPYEGRHTYASLLIAEGSSPVQVAAWMGHSTASTTLRVYAHLFALRPHDAPHSFRAGTPGTSDM